MSILFELVYSASVFELYGKLLEVAISCDALTEQYISVVKRNRKGINSLVVQLIPTLSLSDYLLN